MAAEKNKTELANETPTASHASMYDQSYQIDELSFSTWFLKIISNTLYLENLLL